MKRFSSSILSAARLSAYLLVICALQLSINGCATTGGGHEEANRAAREQTSEQRADVNRRIAELEALLEEPELTEQDRKEIEKELKLLREMLREIDAMNAQSSKVTSRAGSASVGGIVSLAMAGAKLQANATAVMSSTYATLSGMGLASTSLARATRVNGRVVSYASAASTASTPCDPAETKYYKRAETLVRIGARAFAATNPSDDEFNAALALGAKFLADTKAYVSNPLVAADRCAE